MYRDQTLWTKTFIHICILGFLTSFSFMTEQCIPRLSHDLGASASTIGFIASAVSLTALFFTPISAPLMDRYAKKDILTLICILMALIQFGYSQITDISSLIILRLLNGLGKGTLATCTLALVSEILPHHLISKGITYFSLIQSIAIAFAPTIGLSMMNHLGNATPFLLCTILLLLCAILTRKLPIKSSFVKCLSIHFNIHTFLAKEALAPASMMFFLTMAYSTINSFLVVYADILNIKQIGLFFTTYSLVLLVSRPFMNHFMNEHRQHFIVLIAHCCFALSMLILSCAQQLNTFLIAAMISAFGYGLLQPFVQSLCLIRVDSSRRSVASATSYTGTNLGYFLGPMIAGKFIEYWGYANMFAFTIFWIVGSQCLYFNMIKKEKKV